MGKAQQWQVPVRYANQSGVRWVEGKSEVKKYYMSMKKIFIITKSIWTIFLVFFEIGAVTSIFVYGSQFLRPIQDGFDIVERYVLFLAAYEIIVYVTLNFLNDARRDALLALRTTLEQTLLYFETNSDFLKQELLEKIRLQLDTGVFNHLDVRAEYQNLVQLIDTGDVATVKYKLGLVNHFYDMCDLQWKFTFLLRLFK